MDQYLTHSAKNFFEIGNMQSLPDNSLIKKMNSAEFLGAVIIACEKIERLQSNNEMLNRERLSGLFKASSNIVSLVNLIANNRFVARLFQLAMCTSVWRKLDKDDVSILLDIGFKEAATQIIENEVKHLHQTSSLTVVQTPKCMYNAFYNSFPVDHLKWYFV